MIRFRNRTLEEFFIDPVTAVITNSKGEIQKTRIVYGRPYFKKYPIHCLQVHTHIGYKERFDIHHIDENKMNNSLSNLVYLTRSEHTCLHNENRIFSEDTKRKLSKAFKGRTLSEETKRKLSASLKGENHPLFGTKFKWINDGIQNRRCPLDEDIPEGFVCGMLKKYK